MGVKTTLLLLSATAQVALPGIIETPASDPQPTPPPAFDGPRPDVPESLLWQPGRGDVLGALNPAPEAWTDRYILAPTWDWQEPYGSDFVGGSTTWRVWSMEWDEVAAFPTGTEDLAVSISSRDGLVMARMWSRSAGFPRVFDIMAFDLWSGEIRLWDGIPERHDGSILAWNEVISGGELVTLTSGGSEDAGVSQWSETGAASTQDPAAPSIDIRLGQDGLVWVEFQSHRDCDYELLMSLDLVTWEKASEARGTGGMIRIPISRSARACMFSVCERIR